MRCDYCGWDVMGTCDCNSAVLDSKDPVSGIRTSALTDLRTRLSAAEKRAEAAEKLVLEVSLCISDDGQLFNEQLAVLAARHARAALANQQPKEGE